MLKLNGEGYRTSKHLLIQISQSSYFYGIRSNQARMALIVSIPQLKQCSFYVKLLRTSVRVIPSGFSFSNFMYVSLFRFLNLWLKLFPKKSSRRIFTLYKKLFILINEVKKHFIEITSWAVYLSGPYCKIYTSKGTNQKSSFHRGPFQPHNPQLFHERAFWYEKVDRPTSFPGKALGTRL